MRRFLLIALTAIPFAFASPAYAGDGEVIGTLFGAELGGLIGSQIGHGAGRAVATAGGVVLGGYVGNQIGASIDRDDRNSTAQRYGSAPPYPAAAYYPSGAYTPNYVALPDPPNAYDRETGTYCRQYTQQMRIGDQVQESYGTACLQPDGTWRAVQ